MSTWTWFSPCSMFSAIFLFINTRHLSLSNRHNVPLWHTDNVSVALRQAFCGKEMVSVPQRQSLCGAHTGAAGGGGRSCQLQPHWFQPTHTHTTHTHTRTHKIAIPHCRGKSVPKGPWGDRAQWGPFPSISSVFLLFGLTGPHVALGLLFALFAL